MQNFKQNLRFFVHRWANFSGFVVILATIIAISWVMGTLSTIQTNFAAQRALDEKQRQLQLAELEVEMLKYQQNYYQSDEYKELEARDKLGLATPGEKELILPENSDKVKALDSDEDDGYVSLSVDDNQTTQNTPNLQQWLDFLSGKTAKNRLQEQD